LSYVANCVCQIFKDVVPVPVRGKRAAFLFVSIVLHQCRKGGVVTELQV